MIFLIFALISERQFSVNQEAGVGIEHHLRRGRPLAAFQSLLSARVHSAGSHVTHLSRNFSSSYEAQTLLSHITETEESLITAVSCCISSISCHCILGALFHLISTSTCILRWGGLICEQYKIL